MISRKIPLLMVSIFAFWNCSPPQPQNQPNVLASFDTGVITTQDLDQAILALRPEERVVAPEERVSWYTRLTRDLAVGRILIESAEKTGRLETPEFEKWAHHAARELLVAGYLNRNLPPRKAPSEEELKDTFTRNYGDGHRPARAMVSHIFLRYGPAQNKEQITQKLTDLRNRVLSGENFGQLAATHSDSESRHRQGSLGFMTKEQMPPDLQKVVFSLPENTPSEPMFTKDGGHLFFAEGLISEKTFTLEEVRQDLQRKHTQKWLLEQTRQLADSFEEPTPWHVPSEEDFGKAIQKKNMAESIINIGGFEWSLLDLHSYLRSVLKLQINIAELPLKDLYHELLSLAYKERIYQAVRPPEAPVDSPQMPAYLTLRNQFWTEQLIRQRLLDRLLAEPERLREYYQNQKSRFVLPPQVNLKLLTVSLTEQASETMAFMESHRQNLIEGQESLESWHEQLGGNLQETGYLSSTFLENNDPVLLGFAFQVPEGSFSPPFRRAAGLSIFKVLELVPPQEQPFSSIIRTLAQDYLHYHGQDIYASFADEVLTEAHFQFFPEVAQKHGHLAAQTP